MVLYAYVCVCAFSLRRESPGRILGDKPLLFQVGSITMSGSLTSQQLDSCGVHKRMFMPPSFCWPLHWLENTLNQSFLSSNSLSFKIHSNPSLLGEIWAILWVTSSIFKQSTSPMISVCSLFLGTCIGLQEPPRLWWASESLYWPLLHGDLLVENKTRSWWLFGEVWGQERPDPLCAPQRSHRQPLWLAELWEQILCLLCLLQFHCYSCSNLFLLKFDLTLVVILIVPLRQVTEPPPKWGVHLPRTYQRILGEARMRKHNT
jgi:hypothetical protein